MISNYFKNLITSFLLILLFFSCKKLETKNTTYNQLTNPKVNVNRRDSLVISVKFKNKETTGFNIIDKYFDTYYLNFINHSIVDKTLIKKIKKTQNDQIIFFLSFPVINGVPQITKHYYLVNNKTDSISFLYSDFDVKLSKEQQGVKSVDNLFEDYEKFFNKKDLDSLFNKNLNDDKIKTTKPMIALNKMLYINKLQAIDSKSKKILKYLTEFDQQNQPIASPLYASLLYNFAKNNISSIDFQELDIENYSEYFIKQLSIAFFRFLKFEDNKGDIKYRSAIKWLKTTELYKKDSIYIKKKITPLNNKLFKERLTELKLYSFENKLNGFNKILKQNPSPFYLIDFWATWCAPCIKGVNIMGDMNMPKNVKVISLSLDKTKDKEKWKIKTKELEQPITYWLDETSVEGKSFLKFIELQSIPRYLLIDKNMNLIDQAFYHPQESQFLPKLQDVKNHKYW